MKVINTGIGRNVSAILHFQTRVAGIGTLHSLVKAFSHEYLSGRPVAAAFFKFFIDWFIYRCHSQQFISRSKSCPLDQWDFRLLFTNRFHLAIYSTKNTGTGNSTLFVPAGAPEKVGKFGAGTISSFII
jgi:hypothetical protein